MNSRSPNVGAVAATFTSLVQAGVEVVLPRKPGCSAKCFRKWLLEFLFGVAVVEARVLAEYSGLSTPMHESLGTTTTTSPRNQQLNRTRWLNSPFHIQKWIVVWKNVCSNGCYHFTHHEV